MKREMGKQVVLTGLRTNAEYHLGNYLGAIMPIVKLAREKAGEYQINMFAPDLHSFTTPVNNAGLYQQTMQNLKLFVACGLPIDHDDVFVYRQSYISAHSELALILQNFAHFGELERMTQFKDKSGQEAENQNVSAGLFTYPVLMAADILLYGATYVPVGDDQSQHIEYTRDIATRLNNKFGELFVIPKSVKEQHSFIGMDDGLRIKSLRNPTKKMSKSIDDPAGTIMLSDTPEAAAKKVMSAETDSVGSINFDSTNQPGITNLLVMLSALTGQSQSDVNAQYVGQTTYGDLKKAVAVAVAATLTEIQSGLATVDDATLQAKLESSEEAMRTIANETLLKVQKAVGLRA